MKCENICICPFCHENCYTETQLLQHIGAKTRWEIRKGVSLTHADYQFNKQNMCNYTGHEELNAKIDALCKYLKIEFVFERVDDGENNTGELKCYVREKSKSSKK